MALVEIVSGLATDRAIAETLFATAAAWGKTPVYRLPSLFLSCRILTRYGFQSYRPLAIPR